MAEKVEENKRVSVSDRSVGSSQLFQNKTLNPTVGAGGQYNVQVETPAKSKFTRLAEGLSTINPALQAVGESDMAASDLAVQQASEMTMEEVEANTLALKNTEKSLYKQNGWMDRLTRTGKASVLENPLTFSRAQRAAGARIGQEKYEVLLSEKLKSAQAELRANPTGGGYNLIEMQKETANELKEQYGIGEFFSMDRGFDSSVAGVNKKTLLHDANERERIARVHSVVNAAVQGSSLLGGVFGNPNATDGMRSQAVEDFSAFTNGMSRAEISKSIQMMGSDVLSKNTPEVAGAIFDEMRGSELMVGGFPLGSAAYDSAFDALESELFTAEKRREADQDQADNESYKQIAKEVNAIQYDFKVGEQSSFSQAGVDVSRLGLDPEVTYTNRDDMMSAYSTALVKNAPKGTVAKTKDAIFRAGQSSMSYDINQASQVQRKVTDGVTLANKNPATILQRSDMDNVVTNEGSSETRSSLQRYRNTRNAERDVAILTASRGEFPDDTTTRLEDAEGNERPLSTYTADEVNSYFTERDNRENLKTLEGLAEIQAKQEAIDLEKSKADFQAMEDDAKGDSYKNIFKAFELEGVTYKELGVDINRVHDISKGKADPKVGQNILKHMPYKHKMDVVISLSNYIGKGGVEVETTRRVGNRAVIYKEYKKASVKDLETSQRLLDEYLDRTPITPTSILTLVDNKFSPEGYHGKVIQLEEDQTDNLIFDMKGVHEDDYKEVRATIIKRIQDNLDPDYNVTNFEKNQARLK